MKIIAISEIVEMNKELKEKELPYRIHLKDACAGQSFSIEVLQQETQNNKKELGHVVENYFQSQKLKVVYTSDQYHFRVE